MADKEDKVLCVWNMGTPCDGKREKKLMFSKQLEIPICEKHFEEHKEVLRMRKIIEILEEMHA